VTARDRFPAEPWQVREVGLDLARLAQSESIFALSNGHIGVRGNLDEGEPNGLPGTYLNSFYESRPLPYAERGYGNPESGQTVVNVTNGKLIRLLVDDQPLDLRYGRILQHERILDLRGGVLRRDLEWRSPSGQVVRLHSTRLVSFTQRAILAVRYEVEAASAPAQVVVQSELVANEPVLSRSTDPRVAAAMDSPLVSEESSRGDGNRSSLLHRARQSGLRIAAAADHLVEGNDNTSSYTDVQPDWSRTTIGTQLAAGERLTVTKFVAYGWSSARSPAALRDQADAALSAALNRGWDDLVADQQAYLKSFWDGADVELDGDPAVQQAVRFGLFHVLQAGARAEQRAIAAKGLTGPGYDGHAFWDTESYVLPVLTATVPQAAADALRWRHSTLPLALDRARTLNVSGAVFPWRTIQGQECSAYWPAGTAAVHVNADIAVAAARHVAWTGDDDFDRSCALPLLVETARLWMSLGFFGTDGAFHLNGVTGPDEYSALVDDNTYTNLMAAQNLREATGAALRWPEQAHEHEVDETETAAWERAAKAMAVPRTSDGMPEQDRGSTLHERWDFQQSAEAEAYPLLLHAPYFSLYRKQVVKQADLILAMHWCGDSFTLAEKTAAFEYYEELTVRDSSLSACSQAVVAAEVGHLDLAFDYLSEAALMDLRDREHNTGDGVHVASLAGGWIALVCGFGGLRDHGGQLSFAPRLPAAITRLSFSIRWRGCKIRVVVTGDQARYVVEDGPGLSLELRHHGECFTLSTHVPVELAIPPASPPARRPRQPAGRTPEPASQTSTDVAR